MNKLLPAFTLLAALPMLACDEPDGDPVADAEALEALEDPELGDLAGTLAFDPSERDELELLAPEQDEQTVSCSLGLPNVVLAGPSKQRTARGTIYGVATAYYFFDAVRPTFPWLSNWTIKIGQAVVAQLNQGSTFFVGTDGTDFDVVLQAPPGAQPGATYDLEVRLYNMQSQLLCTDEVTLEIADCGQVAWWATGTWPTPWYDNANCYVAPLPQGAQGFIWSNNWYVTPTNGNQCSIGVYDGANCYIGSAPAGHTAFIYDNNLYYTY